MANADVANDVSPSQPQSVFAIRLLIAGLLLATATLKVLSPAESVTMTVAYNIPPLLTAMVVQVELGLAALLLFGCWPKRTLLATAVMFAFLGLFSSYREWAGYESCGCFGSFQASPWITAALDVGLLFLAAWGAWRSPAGNQYQLKRFRFASGVYAALGLLAAAGMITSTPSSLSNVAFADASGLIVLEPKAWIGKPFPLAPHLSPKIPLLKGHWTILIHHHDCPHCKDAVLHYERLALAESDQRIVLIETPPYGEIPISEQGAMRTRLSDSREWFIRTPIEIQVDAGVVVSASLDLPAIAAELSFLRQHDSISDPSSSRFTD